MKREVRADYKRKIETITKETEGLEEIRSQIEEWLLTDKWYHIGSKNAKIRLINILDNEIHKNKEKLGRWSYMTKYRRHK